PDGIVIDELYAQKLGVRHIGESVEINGHRARVAGMTSGIRAFTQSPYIFASLKTAQAFAALASDRATYVLVTADPGTDLAGLQHSLIHRFPGFDVWKASAFSWQTRKYWLLTTGAGVALLIAAVLGLVVGIVIVAQTLYAATVERLPEYATLRAMGAGNQFLHRVILKQSSVGAAIGYGLGMLITGAALFMARDGTAALMLPWPVVVGLAVVTFLMCAGGALISIRKVLKIDPVMVFK
ncbi:MAG TPA: ABC transporter permease, partial [Fimbriimonadaceae bacterium]|nr:ABC transporter permease [Fimbriimonadaceae bacterium]